MTEVYYKALIPTDEERAHFEERVFNHYFVSQIGRTGLGGCLTFGVASDTLTLAELCERSPTDTSDYKDEHISAMWFGFKLALAFSRNSK